jgi:peptide/nickel transport system permease protein
VATIDLAVASSGGGRGMSRPPAGVVAAMVVLGLLAIAALSAPLLVPNATRQDILAGLTTPSRAHPLGTDKLGRDVLQLTIAGARSALIGPLVIAFGSMVLGVLLGTLAGYLGGIADGLLGRLADLLLAIPAVLLAIVVAGILGGSYWITVAVLVLVFCPSDIRLIRGGVLEQKHRPYIEATRMLGFRRSKVMFAEILPNVIPIIIANFMLNIVYGIVAMSSLSYLGLGVGQQTADWGRQLTDGRSVFTHNPSVVLSPGIAIIVASTAIVVASDWIYTKLDERFG